MTKLKQMRFRWIATLAVLVLVVCISVGLGVKAFSGQNNGTVMENVNIETFNEASEGQDTLGAMFGPNVYGDLLVYGRFMQGGITKASSTSNSAETLLITDLTQYSGLDYTPGNAAVTLTLPATSTMSGFIDQPGDCMDWRIRNLDATAATSTTIAAGTGIDLVENENGDVVIEGGNEAQLKFCRELDTDVTVYVDEYIAAD